MSLKLYGAQSWHVLRDQPAACLWLIPWKLRSNDDNNKSTDLYLFMGIHAFSLLHHVRLSAETWSLIWSVLIVISTSAVCLTVSSLYRSSKTSKIKKWPALPCEQPLFLPCQTTHTRMSPKKHTFTYSYLQVSVPVCGQIAPSRLFSIGNGSLCALFRLDPRNYLERHCQYESLQLRLEAYLESQHVKRSSWHYAYLVTSPKFLEYSFNPVSFWYIYDIDENLTMMILEVNNTFDERRMYLLKETAGKSIQQASDTKFKHRWDKDFHVSPFNSRKGQYALTALDAFQQGKIQSPGIDNTIVLYSSKGDMKLVARLFSDSVPLAPSDLSVSALSRFLVQWCWQGFFTFPRILKEAFALFFQRKLHVWLKPEIRKTSVGQTATRTERLLEKFLRQYFVTHVQALDQPIKIDYQTGSSPPEILSNVEANSEINVCNYTTIQVLSPEFFTRMVHYATIADAIQGEGVLVPEESRTIFVSNLDVVLHMLLAKERQPAQIHIITNIFEQLRWQLLRLLRCRPTPLTYSKKSDDRKSLQCSDFSSLDAFVVNSCVEKSQYRRILSKIFMAQRFAFGFSEVIGIVEFTARLYVISAGGLLAYSVHLLHNLKG